MNDEAGVLEAVRAGDADALRALLAANRATAEARDAAGVSALMHALYRGRRDLAATIADARDAFDVFEATALGDEARLAALLAADPSQAQAWSADGFTALHFAAFFGCLPCARALLDAGAVLDAVARGPMKVMPLHSAAAARQAGIAALFIARGADVNAAQEQGFRPLHSSANAGDMATAEALLQGGADPNLEDEQGRTPAAIARERGHSALAERLSAR
jgi:ankyrin repeat protein